METWQPANPPETLLFCCDLLSFYARSKWFWLAWHVQEHGWVDWQPENNPFNISGPISNEVWFKGATLKQNETVAYIDQAHGLLATIEFIRFCFPKVFFGLWGDNQACIQLDEPGLYGRWCPDPDYGLKIMNIMNEIKLAHGV